MQKKIHYWIFLINIALISIVVFFANQDNLFIKLIDVVFYFDLLYTIIFLFLFVLKGRFFDGLVFGFRRFNHVMFNRNDVLEEWKEKPLPSESINLRFYEVVKIQSITLTTLLILLLIIYYL